MNNVNSRRTALVTGASRGIGNSIARRLVQEGYDLTITSRTASALEEVRDDLLEAGAGEVVVAAADMSDRAALQGLVQQHAERFGAMDALVLNAGLGTVGDIATFPTRRLDRVLEVNLASAFILIQESLPLLRKAASVRPTSGARVIGVSSITGVFAESGHGAYGASKAALISLLETLNAEESGSGVMATAVAPGYTATDMTAWKAESMPAESMIAPDDVAEVVAMLLRLSRSTSITKVVMSRSGSGGYEA